MDEVPVIRESDVTDDWRSVNLCWTRLGVPIKIVLNKSGSALRKDIQIARQVWRAGTVF